MPYYRPIPPAGPATTSSLGGVVLSSDPENTSSPVVVNYAADGDVYITGNLWISGSISGAWSGSTHVTSFNTRTDSVTLTLEDVSGAIGYVPVSPSGNTTGYAGLNVLKSGDTMSGRLSGTSVTMSLGAIISGTLSGSTGNFHTVTLDGLEALTGITGIMVSSALGFQPVSPSGSISGQAGTVASIAGNTLTQTQVSSGLGYLPPSPSGTILNADTLDTHHASYFEPAITAGTTSQYWRGDKTWQTHDKTSVGLGSVDNTADSAKSVASAAKLTTARTINSVSFDGTGNITINAVDSTAREPAITAGTTAQYWRGDKSWQTLDKSAVGLGSVDNTADSAKSVASAAKLTTARTINSVSFDGTGNITINAVDSTAREPAITAGTTAQYWRGDKSWQALPTSLPANGGNADTVDNLHASAFEPAISAGTTAQYWRGDKSWQTLPTSLPANGGNADTVDNLHASAFEAAITAGTTAQYWRGDKSWQTLPTSLPDPNALSFGSYLTYTNGSSFNGSAVNTIAVDATSNNTNSKVVARDASGGFSGSIVSGTTGNFTALNINGNAVVHAGNISSQNVNYAATAGNITAYTVNQNVGTSNTVSFDQVLSTNNGNGTNFKVGDDLWIGDINAANTMRLTGVQNADRAYIIFGNTDSNTLGKVSTGNLTYSAIMSAQNFVATSDVRYKEGIQDIEDALGKVLRMRGVSFYFKGSPIRNVGVIAQEINEVCPEVVDKSDENKLSVSYGNIVAVLIEAIKTLEGRVKDLEAIVEGRK